MAEQYFTADPTCESKQVPCSFVYRGHGLNFMTDAGVFSKGELDTGTRLLLDALPDVYGDVLDLGCGWGPIALTLAFESPEANVWAVDVNERAVDLTHANSQANGHTNIHTAQVDESSTPLPAENQPAFCETVPSDLTFDVIWSNPPIRVGKEALHTLLMAWLPKLKVGGAAYLVVQKNLGSDSLIPWLDDALGEGFTASKYASSKGFRIIEVRHEI